MNEHRYQVTWGDLDANNHLRNTAYLDYAATTRFRYLAGAGFTPREFAKLRLGPVVFEDTVRYQRELRLLEEFSVTIELRGQNETGSRFILLNRFFNAAGELAAEVHSHGGWFSLDERKIVAPPPGLLAAMNAMARSEDFQAL